MTALQEKGTLIKCGKWRRSDIPQIAELIVLCWQEYDASKVHTRMKQNFQQWLTKVFPEGVEHFVVARDANGNLAGIAGLTPLKQPHVAEVHSVVVKAALRGLGIGRRLMQAAIKCAISKSYRRIDLAGVKNPTAIKLYESLGFAQTGSNEQGVCMTLSLNASAA